RGQPAEARVDLEQAFKLAPDLPAVANNLAWLLANDSRPDLPRALELVNVALKHSPKELNFRDTRGRILAKLGRWQEALEDLEAALPGSPNNPGLHRALADAYEHLGDPAMAAKHRGLAEEKATPKQPASP